MIEKNEQKDKILLKEWAGVLAQTVVDSIAKNIPGINIAWDLSKALYGAGLKLRQDRALEWVEMVRDNPSYFTQAILNDEKFQDGFVIGLERYITERNESKRMIFRNIFLGYTQAPDKSDFPLEKYIHVLSQLSEVDISTLKDINLKIIHNNYQIYGNTSHRIDNIYNLIGAGILLDVTAGRGGFNPDNSPFIKMTLFGRDFIQYISSKGN